MAIRTPQVDIIQRIFREKLKPPEMSPPARRQVQGEGHAGLQTQHGMASHFFGGRRKLARAVSALLLMLPLLACCWILEEGTAANPLPSRQVTVQPGDNIMALVDQSPPGTAFLLQAGVYRLQAIIPKEGDSFIGAPGAVLDGAQPLTTFSRSGNLWTAPVQAAQQSAYRGECWDTHPACKYPEDLFLDNRPLMRVDNVSGVSPGKWYLDYSAQEIYFADDPTGHAVEISVKPYAIRGDAANVRIEGLTVEKYACAAGDGAVDGRAISGHLSLNWVVQNNVVTLNHGMGIRMGDGMRVLANKVLENGQLGMGGGGRNGLVDGNEIARNNYAGYKYDWEAGGSKFAFTQDLVVRNNYAHDNDGPGLWTDLENENTLYEQNHTASNRGAGIQHEVSYKAIIRNNLIENDGVSDYHKTAPWYGAGIVIAGSSDVEVYGNTVKNCMNGIVGTQPQRELSRRGTPYLLKNLNVHDNSVIQSTGTAAGIVCAGGLGNDVFDSRNNRFINNRFQLADPHAKYFAWRGAELSYGDWESETR